MASPPYDPVDHHVDLTEQAPAVSSDPSSAGSNSKEAPAKREKDILSLDFSPSMLRSICIFLHVLLVLMHVALSVVWWHHFEHKIVIPLQRSGITSSVIVVASQVFATIYTIALVVITQQLAIQGSLFKYQTLTATHDESTAWTGLGSALLVLRRQKNIAASVVGTLLVAVYLIGISILHISTPSLFNLQVFEQPNATNISTTIGMPVLPPVEIQGWSDISSQLPYLAQADSSNTIGVQNGTLYDVLSDNNGTGHVTVGASSFNVTCGSIPNTTVTGRNSTQAGSINTNDQFQFKLDKFAPYVLGHAKTQYVFYRNMIFYIAGPVNVTDSVGNVGSQVLVHPPIITSYISGSGNVVNASISHLTVSGCSLSIVNQSAIVDSRTKRLVSAQPVATKMNSTWHAWNPINTKFDPQIDHWSELIGSMPDGSVPDWVHPIWEKNQYLDVGSQYLMRQLGLYPETSEKAAKHTVKTITLHDLENALASMTALLYWAVANSLDPWLKDISDQDGVSDSIYDRTVLQGWVLVSKTETQLNINKISLAVGFGTSIVLLVTASILIRRSPAIAQTGVDATGILPSMWMAYRHPELQDLFVPIAEPTTDTLRTIGMVKMQLVDETHAPISGSTDGRYHSVSSTGSVQEDVE